MFVCSDDGFETKSMSSSLSDKDDDFMMEEEAEELPVSGEMMRICPKYLN